MRLLGRTNSINVRKVLWTAAELRLPLEHEEDWATPARPTQTPEFLKLNPNGLVPVLVDGKRVLWESNTICRYLAARENRRDLLPRDPFRRALVERWMDWSASDVNRAWSYPFMALVRADPRFLVPREVERGASDWNRLMAVLDLSLRESGPYACGVTFTLADICVGLVVHRWFGTPITRPEFAAVVRYRSLLRQRPAYRAVARDDVP